MKRNNIKSTNAKWTGNNPVIHFQNQVIAQGTHFLICITNLTHGLEVLFPPFNDRLTFTSGVLAVVSLRLEKHQVELLLPG